MKPGSTEPGLYAIGIDVGGSKVASAVVNLHTGALAMRRQFATRSERGGEPILDDVRNVLKELEEEALQKQWVIEGIGLGVAELVSPAGEIFSDYRIAWKGIDLQARLSNRLAVTVESDVRAAALAEALYGAGKPYHDFLFVTIGTGISAVPVRDGKPYAGARGAALVIANGATRHVCEACGHVTSQTLEDIASGPGLVALHGGLTSANQVLAAAEAGEAKAIAAVERATSELGTVLALLVNSLDPAAVVIGGGLGSAPGIYWKRLCEKIQSGLWEGDARHLPVLQAELGADAGIVGAAASIRNSRT